MRKKIVAWALIPVCLFLVIMGMQVPNLANATVTPKPRPRAIIESSYRAAQDATTTTSLLAIVVSYAVLDPILLTVFHARSTRETCRFNSVALSRSGARAPPFFSC